MRRELEIILTVQEDNDVLIIGESHTDNTARQVLINHMDLLVDKSLSRPVVVLMEHFGDIRRVPNYQTMSIETIQIAREIDKSMVDKKLTTKMKDSLLTCSAYGLEVNRQYLNLAEACVQNGIRFGGAETEKTHFSSGFVNYKDRLVHGDEAFSDSVSRQFKNAALKNKPFVVLVCGTAHVLGVKKLLSEQNLHTFATNIVQGTEKHDLYKTNCSFNEVAGLSINPVVADYADSHQCQFDLLCQVTPAELTAIDDMAETFGEKDILDLPSDDKKNLLTSDEISSRSANIMTEKTVPAGNFDTFKRQYKKLIRAEDEKDLDSKINKGLK